VRLPEREAAFLAASRARVLGRSVEWHDRLDSTQDRAAQLGHGGAPEGALVVAQVQTRGRGRSGARWESGAGGLWASVLLYPREPAGEAARLTLTCAESVRDTLLYDFCVPATIKEPNDVLVAGRKVCGILGESSSRAGAPGLDRVVMGIGVNLTNEHAPDLAGIATRLADHMPAAPRPEDLLARILERFERLYRPSSAAAGSRRARPEP
jgi:BirA family biotin operon repressor/biotin-[acetyl-CoA-carboxylase] ligase